jgi:hypothetical protein
LKSFKVIGIIKEINNKNIIIGTLIKPPIDEFYKSFYNNQINKNNEILTLNKVNKNNVNNAIKIDDNIKNDNKLSNNIVVSNE